MGPLSQEQGLYRAETVNRTRKCKSLTTNTNHCYSVSE
jgi:hypothetical protein